MGLATRGAITDQGLRGHFRGRGTKCASADAGNTPVGVGEGLARCHVLGAPSRDRTPVTCWGRPRASGAPSRVRLAAPRAWACRWHLPGLMAASPPPSCAGASGPWGLSRRLLLLLLLLLPLLNSGEAAPPPRPCVPCVRVSSATSPRPPVPALPLPAPPPPALEGGPSAWPALWLPGTLWTPPPHGHPPSTATPQDGASLLPPWPPSGATRPAASWGPAGRRTPCLSSLPMRSHFLPSPRGPGGRDRAALPGVVGPPRPQAAAQALQARGAWSPRAETGMPRPLFAPGPLLPLAPLLSSEDAGPQVLSSLSASSPQGPLRTPLFSTPTPFLNQSEIHLLFKVRMLTLLWTAGPLRAALLCHFLGGLQPLPPCLPSCLSPRLPLTARFLQVTVSTWCCLHCFLASPVIRSRSGHASVLVPDFSTTSSVLTFSSPLVSPAITPDSSLPQGNSLAPNSLGSKAEALI